MNREEFVDKWFPKRNVIRAAFEADLDSLSLPPAEGAEAFLRSHKISGADFVYTTGFENMVELLREFAAQQQPTAEGAEEILEKHMKLCSIQPINGGYPKFIVLVAMTEFAEKFATLHAQRLADKMVCERCKKCKYRGLPDSINEALNSGDGVYRP